MSRASRVPQEWGREPWFMGNQETFREYAASDALPRWLRVTYAAYGHLGANGHATFRQTELAILLGDHGNGVIVPAERQRVREAIDGAIERRLLEPGSKALCLVVPRVAIVYAVGNADAPCKRHPRDGRNDKTVSFGVETTGFNRVVSPQKERQNRVVSGSRPLSLLETPPEHHERPAS